MFNKSMTFVCLVAMVVLSAVSASAAPFNDPDGLFTIDVPGGWSMNRDVKAETASYTLLSPDGNVGIQVAVLKTVGALSTGQLIPLYEEGIYQGARILTTEPYTLNGLDGTLKAYLMPNQGGEVGSAAFYSVINGRAFIISSFIPAQMFQERAPEGDAVINTFQLTALAKGQARSQGGSGMLSGGGGTAQSGAQQGSQSFGGGSQQAAASRAGGRIKILDSRLGDTMTGPYQLAAEKDRISTSTPEVFLIFKYSGDPGTDPFVIVWTYTTKDMVITEFSLDTGGRIDGAGKASLSRPDRGWPKGDYYADIKHRGQVLRRLAFSVE